MTDRELLELAARAVNGGAWHPLTHAKPWNPLTDDGDRYRLAKHLGISIDFEDCCAWKRLATGKLIQEFWGGECGDEPHAVVRVAAEIGRLGFSRGRA